MLNLLSKYSKYIVVIVVSFFIAWLLFHSDPVQEVKTDPIKAKIQTETKSRDSVKKEVKRVDSVRVQYIVKWRKIKADTVYLPCDSVLHKVVRICDTVIHVDSTEIADLKKVVLLDSNIIADQARIIKNDSLTILQLNKKLKRSKFWGKTGTAAGFVGGFVLGKL